MASKNVDTKVKTKHLQARSLSQHLPSSKPSGPGEKESEIVAWAIYNPRHDGSSSGSIVSKISAVGVTPRNFHRKSIIALDATSLWSKKRPRQPFLPSALFCCLGVLLARAVGVRWSQLGVYYCCLEATLYEMRMSIAFKLHKASPGVWYSQRSNCPASCFFVGAINAATLSATATTAPGARNRFQA